MEMRHNRNEKIRKKDGDSRRSESPTDSSPKVRILKSANTSLRVTSPQPLDTPTVTSVLTPASSTNVVHNVVQSSQQQQASQQFGNVDEMIEEMLENTPKVMKLIELDTWSFLEHPVVDFLFGENVSPGSGGFNVVSAVGLQSVGKSSLLNKIAGSNVFRTHTDNGSDDSLLKHVTHGLNLHITRERLFLLDTQPLLSASILDEYLKTSQTLGNLSSDISEPETHVYITSLQLVSFLLAISDYVVVVSDWSLDFHLVKLIATAIMMVGTAAQRAEIIWYCPKHYDGGFKKTVKTLQSLLGEEFVTVIEAGDDNHLMSTVMKVPTRRNTNSAAASRTHSCEKSWLVSAQRFWETSIKKSTLYSDYARFMP